MASMPLRGRLSWLIAMSTFALAATSAVTPLVNGQADCITDEILPDNVPATSLCSDDGGVILPSAGTPVAVCHEHLTWVPDTFLNFANAHIRWTPDLPGTYEIHWIATSIWSQGATSGPDEFDHTGSVPLLGMLDDTVSPRFEDPPNLMYSAPNSWVSAGNSISAQFGGTVRGPVGLLAKVYAITPCEVTVDGLFVT